MAVPVGMVQDQAVLEPPGKEMMGLSSLELIEAAVVAGPESQVILMVCDMVEMEKMTTQLGRQQHLLAILDTLPEAAVLAVTTPTIRAGWRQHSVIVHEIEPLRRHEGGRFLDPARSVELDDVEVRMLE